MNITFYSVLGEENTIILEKNISRVIKKQLWDFIKLKNINDGEDIVKQKFSPFISVYPQGYEEINNFLKWVSQKGVEIAREKLESDLKIPNLDRQLKKRTDFVVKNIDKTLINWLVNLIKKGQLYKLSSIELMKYLTDKLNETAMQKSEIIVKTEILNALNMAEYETYRLNQVKGVSWKVVVGEENEKECLENERAGNIKLGDNFPSGHKYPPNGDYCSCYLIPIRPASPKLPASRQGGQRGEQAQGKPTK